MAKNCFFAKVTREGITAARIFPEDMLVVDQELNPRTGDIVIGQDQETVILRPYFEGWAYLLPDNTCFKPIDITGSKRFVSTIKIFRRLGQTFYPELCFIAFLMTNLFALSLKNKPNVR